MRPRNDTAILNEWEQVKGRISRAKFAKQHGLSDAAMNSLLVRLKKKRENTLGNEVTEQINITQNGPAVNLESKSPRIKTLDDLIKACQIDLNKYKIERWKANKWEVALKQQDGSAKVVPLFQVNATLLPKQLDPVFIHIHPVHTKKPLLVKDYSVNPIKGKALIVPDAQIGFRKHQGSGKLDPFHDRKALDIVLQIAQKYDFTDIVLLGDLIDFNDWSDKFLKEPSFYFTTQPALVEGHWWVSQLRQAKPKARIAKLEGNHEYRLPKMLITHLLAAHGLTNTEQGFGFPSLSLETLLGLRGLGVDFITGYPNNEYWIGPVRVIHGDIARSGAGDTVKALSQNAQETVIQGHIHRIEWASRTISKRDTLKTVAAFSPGCLCRTDYVVPGHTKKQQWQQGAAVVEWEGDDFAISPIVIQNGRAIYNGAIYKARDVLPQINKETADLRDGWTF